MTTVESTDDQTSLIRRSRSMPQMNTVNEDALGEDEEARYSVPKMDPDLRGSSSSSQFWFTSPSIDSVAPGNAKREPRLPVSTMSMLHAAAIMNDKVGLQTLISGDFFDIDLREKFGRTPLMFAVLANYPECAEVLLKNGACPELKDRSGRTAAHWAAHHGHVNCLRILLQHSSKAGNNGKGVRWKEPDQGGVTLLHLATRHPATKCLPLVIKHFAIGPAEINVQDCNKRSALHWAASQATFEYVRLLLRNGASVDMVDVEGKTPLHWAASSGGIISNSRKKRGQQKKGGGESLCSIEPRKTVQALMSAAPGVINWQDYEGRTALHLAVADSDEDVVLVLAVSEHSHVNALDHSYRSALHWASVLGRAGLCSLLLDRRARYPCQDAYGATPLHYAVQAGQLETVEALMKRPEVLDHPDLCGRTALLWAAALNELPNAAEILRCLCRHGSDLAHADHQGSTALHVAVATQHLDAVKALTKLGIDLNIVDHRGLTPLSVAAQMGHAREARALLEQCTVGAGGHSSSNTAIASLLQAGNDLGQMAIHLAAQAGQTELVSIFLQHSSMSHQLEPKELANAKDCYGRTPLVLASHGGFVACMSLLLEEGADILARDNEGMCSLHWSAMRGHLDAVRLLLMRGAPTNNIALRRLRAAKGEEGEEEEEEEDMEVSLSSSEMESFTPLDSAIRNDHSEIVQCLKDVGGMTRLMIQVNAATRIQAWYKGLNIRKSFNEHRILLLRHEKLRAEKKGRQFGQTTSRGNKVKDSQIEWDQSDDRSSILSEEDDRRVLLPSITSGGEAAAGDFLSQVVEAAHLRRMSRRRRGEGEDYKDSMGNNEWIGDDDDDDVDDGGGGDKSGETHEASLQDFRSFSSPFPQKEESSVLSNLPLSAVTGKKIEVLLLSKEGVSSQAAAAASKSSDADAKLPGIRRDQDKKYSYNMSRNGSS